MEPVVLDKDLNIVGVVDVFASFIWTERYCGAGDFELYTPLSTGVLDFMTTNCYLYLAESDRLMVIDTITIETDDEKGSYVLAKGSSLESILERRIVWHMFAQDNLIQEVIINVLEESILLAVDHDRRIPRLTAVWSEDPVVNFHDVAVNYLGENLYDSIKSLCETADLGFKITMPTFGSWVFEVYAGKDRSHDQDALPYVVFSPDFENLLNSKYVTSTKLLKTVALVGGEGEGNTKSVVTASQPSGSKTGLDRREIYVDASSVSSNAGEIPEAEYDAQLEQKGLEALVDQVEYSIFDGEAQVDDGRYAYGRDYNLGDIVQIANEYGLTSKSRIVEYIRNEDENGITSYPTFMAL